LRRPDGRGTSAAYLRPHKSFVMRLFEFIPKAGRACIGVSKAITLFTTQQAVAAMRKAGSASYRAPAG